MKTVSVVYVAMVLAAAWQAWFTNYAHSTECAIQSEILAEYARYNRMEGGIPKNENPDVLPNGSIVTLIVDKHTREWKILTVRPDTITCVVFEGMSWTGSDD